MLNDVATRWNSTFYMIERFIKLKEALKITIVSLTSTNITILTETEWCVAEEMCTLLRPLEKATREMSAEHYLTASKIIPVSYGFINIVAEHISENNLIYMV